MVCFTFRDDGPGFPDDVLRAKQYNTGLYLIENIVQRDLRGELQFHNDGGAVTTIKFKATDHFKEDSHDQEF
jgi:two-component sensor histidine kinase